MARKFIAALLLLLAVFILAFAMTSSSAANRDFISYWAAGKQLLYHGNPYDGPGILRWEQNAGFAGTHPFFMRNAPNAFFLAVPLGLLGARSAAVCWSLLLLASLALSIRLVWIMEGRPRGRLHLVGYIFPPALACLLAGQIGLLLLLGFTLFLYLQTDRPWLAGTALVLCSVKPHLFLPFGVVLLLWCVRSRSWRILGGAASAIAASLLLAHVLDRDAWSQYAQMVSTAGLRDELVPSLSLIFRLLIHRDWIWLQVVPAAAACIWALWWALHIADWDWRREGHLLLLVSVMTAPYAWVTDEAILIPAMLVALYRLERNGLSMLPYLCATLPALLEVLFGVQPDTPWYLWTTPAWLAFYLYAARAARNHAASVPAPSVAN
ncbi:MAG TPA: glycosyltransferase 87 family protein [Acidobacteriaceae bacterium]|nr:glycosyltransferase 87 family protein [Acidobacteriaceae bacterium]